MSRLRALVASPLVLVARLAVAAPLPEAGYGLPRDVSRDGHHVDALIHFTMAAATVIFVIVLAAMLWAIVRHGRSHQAVPEHGSRATVGLLVATLVVIGVAVDGSMLVKTLIDMNEVFWNFESADRQPGAIRIEINAHQWAWTARYPGPDGIFGTADDVVTTNDIRIPLDRPIVLQLASTDVIHSFYLPNFRVKRDAMPGMVNALWFQAEKTGEYEIGCAQHCGPNHYKMRGVLTVLKPDEYDRWITDMAADARRAYDAGDKEAHWAWEWRRNM